jgi:hypothetical protein
MNINIDIFNFQYHIYRKYIVTISVIADDSKISQNNKYLIYNSLEDFFFNRDENKNYEIDNRNNYILAKENTFDEEIIYHNLNYNKSIKSINSNATYIDINDINLEEKESDELEEFQNIENLIKISDKILTEINDSHLEIEDIYIDDDIINQSKFI